MSTASILPQSKEPGKNPVHKFFANAFVQVVPVFIALAVAFSGKLDSKGTLVAVLITGVIGCIGIYTHCSSTPRKKILAAVSILIYVCALWAFYSYLTSKPIVSAGNVILQNPPQPVQPPPKSGDEKAKSGPKPAPTPSINTGPITPGPCSNIQIGGSNNQATTNCGPQLPPKRVLSPEKLISLVGELKTAVGSVQVVAFSEDDEDDVLGLTKQLQAAFRSSGWSLIQSFDLGNANLVMVSRDGQAKRLGGKSLVCTGNANESVKKALAALGNAGLNCLQDSDFYSTYGPHSYVQADLVILISKRIPK
jgi:hypothetical protein